MEESQNSPSTLSGLAEAFIARGCIVFFFLFAFVFGAFVAGACLHDPDTCWLLSVGRHIVENGEVPRFDPFSYTFSALSADGSIDYAGLLGVTLDGVANAAEALDGGRVFIAYQWLTEVVFYFSYLLGAGYGLTVLVSLMLVSAMLLGPLWIFRYLKSPLFSGMLLIFLAVIGASFHFLARPEVFSYLLLTIMLCGLTVYRKCFDTRKEVSKLVFFFPLLMLIWANVHTGFVFGLIIGTVFAIATTLEAFIFKESGYGKLLSYTWAALASAFLVCCINPYGLELWSYLPGLFFSPINKYIVELKPLSLSDMSQWTYYPFLAVSAIVTSSALRALRQRLINSDNPRLSVFSILGIVIATGGAIICRRMIPFCTLYLVAEAAWLKRGQGESEKPDSGAGFIAGLITGLNRRLAILFKEQSAFTIALACAMLGVYLISNRVMEPVIPQSSISFAAPYEAIEYLSKNMPEGRMLNDPQIGDMIIWHLANDVEPMLAKDPWRVAAPKVKPKVFIDTRFDMYGAHLVDDYFKMATCAPGWREIFDKYQFDWIFLLKNTPLTDKLLGDEGFSPVYQDDRAVILVRAPAN